MTKRSLVVQHREAILALAAKHRATEVRLFGSVARGDERAESDIDFLVKFDGGGTLRQLCGLAEDLEALLGCKVDLITEHPWMKPRFRANIAGDLMPV